jgi:hypothetical protein
MEPKTVPPPAPQTEAQAMPSQLYTPPKATFVPLKLEERLLAAGLNPFECRERPTKWKGC